MSANPSRMRLSLCTTLVLATCAAHAQTTPADAADRIQREELERQRRQMEQNQRNLPPPRGTESKSATPGSNAADTTCREIREIVIRGATHMSELEQRQIGAPFLKRCLYIRDIEKLLTELTNRYIQRGFVTTRAYLPQQDLSKGHLEILVVEGKVEKISVEDGGKKSISLGNVLPGAQKDEILNIRDLEQGLDQINRLQSNSATFDILPGEEPGGSNVVIHNTPGNTTHASLSWDNYGSRATGKDEALLNAGFDNVFGFDDFFSATYRQSVPEHRDSMLSHTESAAYILPMGYNTLSLSFSKSRYVSQVNTASGLSLKSSGRSTISALRLDRVIHRSSTDRATLAGTITTKSTRNYLADEQLSVSSRNLTIFDIDFNYTSGVYGTVTSIDLGISQGTREMHAQEDAPDLPREAPRAQFLKYKYGAGLYAPFRVRELDASFNSTLVGQWSRHALYGSEQMLIGGIYSVRGFSETNLSGDNGFYVHNDLSVRVPVEALAEKKLTLRPYVGLDFGRASMRFGGTDAPSGWLSGLAVGASLGNNKVSLDIFNARPLTKPGTMQRESSSTWIKINLSI